uniref:Uncharacterized protein n=1 Tax=Acrobeloides nanus TaxID=290746 RepID=A0A914D0H7_9BILA
MKEPGTYVEYIHLWPQSERLETAIQSGRYDYVYTMPGVKIHQPLIDKMAYAASQIMEQPLVRPTVACDMNGLKQLIVSGNLKAAFNLTTSLLELYGQGYGKAGQPTKNTLETFEIWSCRFQLMMALKLYSNLIEEISPFEELDAPDTYFDYHPEYRNLGYTGSMVTYSLRLIHAEILRFTPEPWGAMKRILKLECETKKILDLVLSSERPAHEKSLWKQRVPFFNVTFL